ncbi:MAG: acyloxyacyl hydrolase [Deltaproteobacteria bacterium]|jgi:opacity protein-like surface antigen
MMRRKCGNGLMVMVLAVAVLLPGMVRGAEFDVSKFHREVGLRFAYGKNTKKASVHLYSLLPRWGIFLIPPGKSMGPFGISFVAEGIISVAGAEETGFEVGITPLIKFSCLLFPSVLAYIEGGAGIISESIDSPALAHAFNFTPQVGAGFDIAMTPQLAVSVAYRFRHSSNAGIYKENPAFNVNFFQCGLNYYY